MSSEGNRQAAEFNFHELEFPKIPRYQFKARLENRKKRIGRKKRSFRAATAPGILTVLRGINLSSGILRVALP